MIIKIGYCFKKKPQLPVDCCLFHFNVHACTFTYNEQMVQSDNIPCLLKFQIAYTLWDTNYFCRS